MAFNRRIIYNDLIGIAISCIVSLLFVHGVCQFLGSSNKENNTTQQSQQSDDSESSDSGQAFNLAEANQRLVSSFVQPTRNFKIVGHINLAFVAFIENSPWLISQDYRYATSLVWNPSIPIVYRKLLI